MIAKTVVCVACKRVLAIGAGLPAKCLEGQPVPHGADACVEMDVIVPDDLAGRAALEHVSEQYRDEIAALVALNEQV